MTLSRADLASRIELMRLNRPVGVLLLLWPTLAALWLAQQGTPSIRVLLAFAVGTFVMRTAGCIANDIADRDFDPHVRRTARRPLADGRVSVREAFIWLAVFLALALAIVITLNVTTRWMAVAGVAIALIYPLLKRWTHLPQLCLGIAFSWGILMAFTAIRQTVPVYGWTFFLASFFWIVAYDTQYAMVDREDDLHIGVKSTAILFGKWDVLVIHLLMITMYVSLLTTHILADMQLFSIVTIGIVFICIYQYQLVKKRDPSDCFNAFRSNVWIGFVMFLAAVLEYL